MCSMLHCFFGPILSLTKNTHTHTQTHTVSLYLSLNYKTGFSALLCTSQMKISLKKWQSGGNVIINNDIHGATHSFTQSHTKFITHVYGRYALMYLGFWKKASSGIVEGKGVQAVKSTSEGRRARRPIYIRFSFFFSNIYDYFLRRNRNFFHCIRQ